MDDQIIETYFDEEKINKTIDKIKDKKYNDFKKTFHTELSLLRKGTDEKEIVEIYAKFDRVKLIQERKLRYGDIAYDLHYELDDGTYIVIAICIEKSLIINAFHAKKNLKNLIKKLQETYDKKS